MRRGLFLVPRPSSLHLRAHRPERQQQAGGFPKIYTKEDDLVQLGIVSAARLTMTVEVSNCPTDVNGDGVTNVLDLIDLLLCFGQPAVPGCEPQDVNADGAVNVLDLIDLLLNFGEACP